LSVGAQQHVAPVEDLVEEGVRRAQDALVGEVGGAPRRHEVLEVDGAHEVGLHRALGDLAREQAGRSARLVEDAPEHGRGELALGGAGRPGEQHVLFGEQAERDLAQHVVTLEEALAQLLEERAKPPGGAGEALVGASLRGCVRWCS
jgi:hypothetical protein